MKRKEKKNLFLLNLLTEVFLVSRAACWCDGVLGTKRNLWGLVLCLSSSPLAAPVLYPPAGR